MIDRMAGLRPFDAVDDGLVHAAEELAGIGRKGLDVTPLALRVDGVESQGALAACRGSMKTVRVSLGIVTSRFLRLFSGT